MTEFNPSPGEYGETAASFETVNDMLSAGENSTQITAAQDATGEEYNSTTKGKGFIKNLKGLTAALLAVTVLPVVGASYNTEPPAEDLTPPPVVEPVTEYYGFSSDFIVDEDGFLKFSIDFKDENGYYCDFFAAVSYTPQDVEDMFGFKASNGGTFPFDLEAVPNASNTSIRDPNDYLIYSTCEFSEDPSEVQLIDVNCFYGAGADYYLTVGCTSTENGKAETVIFESKEINLYFSPFITTEFEGDDGAIVDSARYFNYCFNEVDPNDYWKDFTITFTKDDESVTFDYSALYYEFPMISGLTLNDGETVTIHVKITCTSTFMSDEETVITVYENTFTGLVSARLSS